MTRHTPAVESGAACEGGSDSRHRRCAIQVCCYAEGFGKGCRLAFTELPWVGVEAQVHFVSNRAKELEIFVAKMGEGPRNRYELLRAEMAQPTDDLALKTRRKRLFGGGKGPAEVRELLRLEAVQPQCHLLTDRLERVCC
eukprot:scaffold124228_cov26-Tisochrysis_lutea.AAC.4